jgi:hypothetical protein
VQVEVQVCPDEHPVGAAAKSHCSPASITPFPHEYMQVEQSLLQ